MRTRAKFLVGFAIAVTATSCSGQKAVPADAAQKSPAASSASQTSPAAGAAAPTGSDQPAGTGDAMTLIADYQQQCSDQATLSDSCETLRNLLVAEISTELQLIERSADLRGLPQALAALDLAGEPDITIAAYRVLRVFPTTPGIAVKVLPQLLANPYVEVQRTAAELLTALSDQAGADAARAWLHNHSDMPPGSPYDEYPDFPAHYASMNFPKYPGAEWFSPADSDRSIGWSTKDDAAAVTKWFSDTLHGEPLDALGWMKLITEQAMLRFDKAKMGRFQEVMQKALAGDKAAAAEAEKLKKEIDQADEDTKTANEKSTQRVAPPDQVMGQAHWIVAQKKGARLSRVVLIYPLQGLQRTVIQFAWDLSDYPSAWPKSGS